MPPLDLRKALIDAVTLHRAGRLAEAEALYRHILTQYPNEPDALHLLGVLLGQSNQIDPGISLIQKAISLRPTAAEFHCNLGNFYQRQKNHVLAAAEFQTAVTLKPDFAEAHYSLALALHNLGNLDASIAAARRAIQLRPNHAESYNVLGSSLMKKPLMPEAIAAFRQALILDSTLIDAHNNLGVCLAESRDTDTAIAAFKYAISLQPDHVGSHVNLAGALREKDLTTEAAAEVATALRLDPNAAAAHVIHGLLEFDAGHYAQAMSAFNHGLSLDATLSIGQWNRGLLRLMQGDFENGWRDYDWRLKDPISFKIRPMPMPQWTGSDPAGRRILIHSEQGLGDTIQFIRFAPILAARGAQVLFYCHAELANLLANFPGIAELIPIGDPLPSADFHCPLLSLPNALNIASNIPASVPYIHADPQQQKKWSDRMGRSGSEKGAELHIGLAWAGRPDHRNDRNRSLALEQLSPLFHLPGIRFFSLQKGPASRQLAAFPDSSIIDWTTELNDFTDTAALIANLDLVITVDTVIAHLAGAMAKPTWILLPHVPDWRWMLDREDTPWYPTARLFRQLARGDWAQVVGRVRQAVSEFHPR